MGIEQQVRENRSAIQKLFNIAKKFFQFPENEGDVENAILSVWNTDKERQEKIEVDLFALKTDLNETASITIRGKEYQLIKHPDNNDPLNVSTPENNDIVFNIIWSATEIWDYALIKDVTISLDDRTAWNIMRRIGTTENDDPDYDAGDKIVLV